jgi:predicted nucleic acid-binding protein
LLSILDTNIFAGMFYFRTKSCNKIFNNLNILGHQIGVCDLQVVEIRSLFEKILRSNSKSEEYFSTNFFKVELALNLFEEWYESSACVELDSNLTFEESQLTLLDQKKYSLLIHGGINSHNFKVTGDPNDLFFLRNVFHNSPQYFVTNDSQILLSCDAFPENEELFGKRRGEHGYFHRTKVFSSKPFLCTEIFSRNWEFGVCVDK